LTPGGTWLASASRSSSAAIFQYGESETLSNLSATDIAQRPTYVTGIIPHFPALVFAFKDLRDKFPPPRRAARVLLANGRRAIEGLIIHSNTGACARYTLTYSGYVLLNNAIHWNYATYSTESVLYSFVNTLAHSATRAKRCPAQSRLKTA
jgi:hypothetical protein